MTSIVGQRGIQPHYGATFRRKKAQVQESVPSQTRTGDGIRFGSNLKRWGIDRSVNFFQKITEVFVWGFLAQDVIAMWLPRVSTSLRVGREKYDPEQDPQTKNLPFHQKMEKWIAGNVKGLNWVNFNEETKREIATGPGLLAVPALLFTLNRMFGNVSIELSNPSLKGFGKGLKEHLKHQIGQTGIHNETEYRNAIKSYVANLFIDPEVISENSPAMKKAGLNLRQWANDWVDNFYETDVKKKKVTTEKLAKELNTQFRKFNREHRINPYNASLHGFSDLIQDAAPLHHTEQTWISYRPDRLRETLADAQIDKAKKLITQKPLSAFTEELRRMEGFVKKTWRATQGQDLHHLPEITENTMKKLVSFKFAFGVATTGITALYLLKLAFWAQNHNSYQAIRLLKEDVVKSKHCRQQQSFASSPQLQAGLPFGSQPVFSRYMARTPWPLPSPSHQPGNVFQNGQSVVGSQQPNSFDPRGGL